MKKVKKDREIAVLSCPSYLGWYQKVIVEKDESKYGEF
jgi:hypothetical protein